MKRWIHFAIAIILSISVSNCNKRVFDKSEQNLMVNQKTEDFEYLYQILKENYPYFEVLKRQTGYDWLSHKNDFIEKIRKTTTDREFFDTISSITNALQCGHVSVLYPDEYYNDIEMYSTDITNRAWTSVLKNKTTQYAYTYWSSVYGCKISEGQNSSNENNGCLESRIIEKDAIAYMKLSSFDTFGLENDSKRINNFYKEIADYKYLIIDIRGNQGGDSRYIDSIVSPLIDKKIKCELILLIRGGKHVVPFINCRGIKLSGISDLPKTRSYPEETFRDFKYYSNNDIEISPEGYTGFKGKIFLLVDDSVFSSSEMFAVFCKDTHFATVVGTRTGGDGPGFDPVLLSLPNSGIVIRFPADYGLNPNGSSNFEMKTTPDIIIDPSKGEDALEKALELIRK